MIKDAKHAEAVQARRKKAKKAGGSRAVRRWNRKNPKERVAYERGAKRTPVRHDPPPETET